MTRIRAVWSVVWRLLAFYLLWGGCLATLLVPMGARLGRWEQTAPLRARLYADIAGAVTVLIATWVMTRLVDRRPFATIGLAPARLIRDLPLGLALGAAWLALSPAVAWLGGGLSVAPASRIGWGPVAGKGVALAFNILTQQLLLCGYVLQTLRARVGFPAAVLVSALLFSGYHAGAFHGAWLPPLNVFAAGVLFCLAYALTGALWLPIGIHFAWDYLLGPVLGLTMSGHLASGRPLLVLRGPALLSGGEFGLEGGLVVTATTALVVAAGIVMTRRRARRPASAS